MKKQKILERRVPGDALCVYRDSWELGPVFSLSSAAQYVWHAVHLTENRPMDSADRKSIRCRTDRTGYNIW